MALLGLVTPKKTMARAVAMKAKMPLSYSSTKMPTQPAATTLARFGRSVTGVLGRPAVGG